VLTRVHALCGPQCDKRIEQIVICCVSPCNLPPQGSDLRSETVLEQPVAIEVALSRLLRVSHRFLAIQKVKADFRMNLPNPLAQASVRA
jgi:hypothetical protein